MEKTGAVGESIIHMCLLIDTDIHKKICKRILKFFPKMVNDIYLSDIYFGENPLHIAIVAEDPNMVNFLLSCGANYHQRASGTFFNPDDQRTGREDPLDEEHSILPLRTNYHGYAYFGEYPISFAALINQEECIRLLIAYGADPNMQDSNGNTVLHMLVINNNLVKIVHYLRVIFNGQVKF
jgi:transient receptor potential cation channel subfamily V member 5